MVQPAHTEWASLLKGTSAVHLSCNQHTFLIFGLQPGLTQEPTAPQPSPLETELPPPPLKITSSRFTVSITSEGQGQQAWPYGGPSPLIAINSRLQVPADLI